MKKNSFHLGTWILLVLFIILSDVYGQPLDQQSPRVTKTLDEILTNKVVSYSLDLDDKTRHINCNASGFFPIEGSCTEFYLCEHMDQGMDKQASSWITFTFACPSRMIFDEEKNLCVVPLFIVEQQESKKEEAQAALKERCGNQTQIIVNMDHANNFLPETSASLNRSKRRVLIKSDTKSIVCKNEEAIDIASTTQEICNDIRSIDDYVSHVKTMDGARLPALTGEKYLRPIKNYNRDLEVAQGNAEIWRKESDGSLRITMREAVLSAKDFGEVFNREFKVNLNRIGVIVDSEGAVTSGSDMVVKKMGEQMINLKAIYEEIKNSSDAAIILSQMKIIKQKLDAYERANEAFAKKYEIPEIIKFLVNVQNRANHIFSKAEDAGNMMSEFENNILQDLSRFKRHAKALNESRDELVNDKASNQQEVLSVQRDIVTFTNRRTSVEGSLLEVKSKKADATNKLWNLRNGRRKRSPVHPVILIAGGLLAGWGIKEILDEDDPEYWENEIRDLQSQIRSLEAQINSFEGNIRHYNNRLSSLRSRSDTLEREILYMGELDVSFKALGKEVSSVLIPVTNAKNAVMKIKTIFQAVVAKLESLIDEAKSAQVALESRDIRYFLYNEIGIMKCLWDAVSERLTPFVGCL